MNDQFSGQTVCNSRAEAVIIPRDRLCASVAGQIVSRPRPARPLSRTQPKRLTRRLSPFERRRNARVSVALQAKFNYGGTLPPATGKVTNLSSTGLFIQTGRVPRLGKLIAISVRVDDTETPPIGLIGKVAWKGRCRQGFGIRFLYMSLADHSRIRSIIAADG